MQSNTRSISLVIGGAIAGALLTSAMYAMFPGHTKLPQATSRSHPATRVDSNPIALQYTGGIFAKELVPSTCQSAIAAFKQQGTTNYLEWDCPSVGLQFKDANGQLYIAPLKTADIVLVTNSMPEIAKRPLNQIPVALEAELNNQTFR